MTSSPENLEDVLVKLEEAASSGEGNMTIGEMLDAFAERSFGALLTLIALLACIPVISAIPGFSILTGTLLILVALQYLFGRTSPWIPDKLRSFSVDRETMQTAVKRSRPYAAAVDRYIRPRWTFLAQASVMKSLIALSSIALAATFYPLALVPGGVTLPALSIAALGLALIGRDGVLAVIGGIGVVATASLLVWFFV